MTPTRMPPVQPAMLATPGSGNMLKYVTVFVLGLSLGFLLTMQIDPGTNVGETTVAQFAPGDDPDLGPGVAATVPGGGGTGGGGQGNTGGGSSGGGASVGGAGGAGDASASGEKAGLSCDGDNGGKTDTGVSEDKIKLAANVVTDGPGANFLSSSPTGMQAVINRVNAEGGICGRILELKTVNDSWDAPRGQTNIENFIAEGYFALPVVPSSEGLSQAIDAGIIENAGIPVIGTDGMRQEQYNAGKFQGKGSWVAPVAVATVSQVRIMVDYAVNELQAETFGIVWDTRYKFGKEGADAYKDYIKKVGKTVKADAGIAPGQGSYATEANDFKKACGDAKCDVVVFLLEPVTAQTWVASAGADGNGRLMTAGAQPLFNDKFARGCGSVCNNMLVWTGYNPAIGDENLAKPDVNRYVTDVKKIDPSADITNQFMQGAYLGMEVFVELLEKCSPNLTRACIKANLDSLDHSSDLAIGGLSWRADDHFSNKGARAYAIKYQGNNFAGFEDKRVSGTDPDPGNVPG